MPIGEPQRWTFTVTGQGEYPAGPEPGDRLLNPRTGTCYAVEVARRSPTYRNRFNLVVVRLEQWTPGPDSGRIWTYTYSR